MDRVQSHSTRDNLMRQAKGMRQHSIQWGLHKTINPKRVSILHIIDQVQPQTFTDNLQDPNKNDRELIDFVELKKKYENETFNTLLSY